MGLLVDTWIIQTSSSKIVVSPQLRNCFPLQNYLIKCKDRSALFYPQNHVYGSIFFGKKCFYGDEFNFKNGPFHPADRRKIRIGLKIIADSIIQLVVENLKTCLFEKDSAVADFREN